MKGRRERASGADWAEKRWRGEKLRNRSKKTEREKIRAEGKGHWSLSCAVSSKRKGGKKRKRQ